MLIIIKQSFNNGWFVGKKSRFFGMDAKFDKKAVSLPHDAMIEQQRSPDAPAGGKKGFWPDGVCEYTKEFSVDEGWQNKRVYFEFEGVYRDAEVLINGDCAHNHPYGYTGFIIPANRFLSYGKENKISVTARSSDDSRWYSGLGIYRPVHLHVGELVHIPPYGVKISTPEINEGYGLVCVETLVRNDSHLSHTLNVKSEIISENGDVLALDTAVLTVFAGSEATLRQRILIDKPKLWNLDAPCLYTCRSTVLKKDGGQEFDTASNRFGIRSLALDVRNGFQLNGEPLKLRGACIHHDNGPLGAATFAASEYRRIKLLKEAGFNSIRMAHHPASVAMLNACDELGMLVMDEAFDMWGISKSDYDYGNAFQQCWQQDIEAMVQKDFNHPSVIMYSIGNEIPDTGSPVGSAWGRKLSEAVRRLDDSRYTINSINGILCVLDDIQSIMNSGGGDINQTMSDAGDKMNQASAMPQIGDATEESFACVDIAGYNYMDSRYEADHLRYPGRVICGSETFPRFIGRNWPLILKSPHVIGDYTWTGWDYLGEAGIGKVDYGEDSDVYSGWPWLAAWCGDIDIIGRRRPASFYREIVFGLRKDPYIAVQKPVNYGKKANLSPWSWTDSVSGWSWDGYENKAVVVEVYADADEVSLLCNGVETGRCVCNEATEFKAVFETVYTAGELCAIAYKNGNESGRYTISTAKGNASLHLSPRQYKPCEHEEELIYTLIEVLGENGEVVHQHSGDVTVSVEGPAVLAALGSANPVSEQNFFDDTISTFNGQLLAIVKRNGPGEIKITASAPDLGSKSLEVV